MKKKLLRLRTIGIATALLAIFLVPQAVLVPSALAANADLDINNSIKRDDVINCEGDTPDKLKGCYENNPLVQMFNVLITFLAIGVGVIVVVMIVIGGIQYTTAGGNPQAVGAARKRIINAVLALVAFMFLYSFMQWLIPGGIF